MEESVAECKKVLGSKNFHVRTDGTIAHSLATDTVKYLLKGMLRNVGTVARESYREEPESSFTHNGKKYNLNKVLTYIDANHITAKEFKVSDLAWVLKYDQPNPDRIKKADLTTPIIVVENYSETAGSSLVAVDGLHRVARAVQDNVDVLTGYELTKQQLAASQRMVSTEADVPLYMDASESLPHHLLNKTSSEEVGGPLASTQTSMLSPGLAGVHVVTTVNGVYASVESDAVKLVDRNLLSYPKSFSSGITQDEIDALTLTGQEVLDVEYNPATGNYYVLGPYVLLAKLLQSKAPTLSVKIVSTID